MKKIIGVLFLVILCGCSKAVGSFQEGTMDMDQLYDRISEQIVDGEWNMGMLNDAYWSKNKIEKAYDMDMTQIEDCFVKSSLIEAQFSEIAFFKVDKKYDDMIKKGIEHRLQTLHSTWGSYIEDAQEQLKKVKQGRIGKYYYMILGEDCKKVVNYIRNYK